MRAILAPEPGGPEALHIVDTDQPRPGEGEVLIKVTAAGVNRADILQRRGFYPPPPGYSDILGLEVSGTIAEVGPSGDDSDAASRWNVGDECVALLAAGGYAEYVVAPAGQVIPPPPGMDLVDAAGVIEVAATVVSNMERARLAEGDNLLVHGGAGGIGSFTIQYGKARGCTVFTTAGSPEKLDYCRSLGADHPLNYHEDWVAQIKEITDGYGVDVVLDIMGAKYLESNMKAMALDGRQVTIGLQGGRKAEINLGALLTKRLTVMAAGLRAQSVAAKSAVCAKVEETVWPMLGSGTIQPTRTQRVPFDEAARAHELMDSEAHHGKIVLAL